LPVDEYVRIASTYVQAITSGSSNPIQDVAQKFKLPISTVRSRIHAARDLGVLDRGRRGYATARLNPANGRWQGFYVCTPDGRSIGTSVIANDEVMILYSGNSRPRPVLSADVPK
jgi:hypothetical protein